MAPSALIAQLLGALGYPAVATFDAGNQGEVQELVNWLENMKIRQYPEDAREHMRSTDPEAWAAALRKYLVDLECPLALDSASDPAVLRWLLMRAGARRTSRCHFRSCSALGARQPWGCLATCARSG